MANKSRDIKRRNVLKGIGAIGLGTFGIGSASADETKKDIEITIPSDNEKNRIIARAQSDERTRTLTKMLKREGYTLTPQERKVSVTRQSGEVHHRTVLLPFQSKSESDDERMIYWTDLEEDDPEIPPVAIVTINGLSEPGNREVIVETAADGVVSETQEADDSSTSSTTGPSTQSHACGGCPCCKAKLECESYNWACITFVVGSAAGTVLACGTCYASLGLNPTCAACFMAVSTNISGYVAGADCNIGNNCERVYDCFNPRMCS